MTETDLFFGCPKQRISRINSHSSFMTLACWSMKTLTACRTACQTLQSVYWAAGDTGQPRMSASDLFSPQLLSVTASCLKQTIFVSQCNYHHLVILTMLTASALQPVNVNVVLVQVLLLYSVALHVTSYGSGLIKGRWWEGKTFPFISYRVYLGDFIWRVLALSLPLAHFHTYWQTSFHFTMQVNSVWV